MFVQEDPLELNEYRDDLRTECEKFGQARKVIIFDVSLNASQSLYPSCISILAFESFALLLMFSTSFHWETEAP